MYTLRSIFSLETREIYSFFVILKGGIIMKEIMKNEALDNLIYEIRGKEVMLDSDLAELYQVETKRINEAVKIIQKSFQKDFYLDYQKKNIYL